MDSNVFEFRRDVTGTSIRPAIPAEATEAETSMTVEPAMLRVPWREMATELKVAAQIDDLAVKLDQLAYQVGGWPDPQCLNSTASGLVHIAAQLRALADAHAEADAIRSRIDAREQRAAQVSRPGADWDEVPF